METKHIVQVTYLDPASLPPSAINGDSPVRDYLLVTHRALLEHIPLETAKHPVFMQAYAENELITVKPCVPELLNLHYPGAMQPGCKIEIVLSTTSLIEAKQ